MRLRVLGTLMALIGVPVAANAQACLGVPGFSRGLLNLRGIGSLGNDASQIGAGIQLGGPSLFGGIGYERTSFRDFDHSGNGVVVNLGYQIPFDAEGKTVLCPLVEGSLTFGPDFEFEDQDWKLRNRIVFGGVGFGTTASGGGNLLISPSFQAMIGYGGTKVTADNDVIVSGSTVSGLLRAAIGLLFAKGWGLTPFVNVPLGVEDADPTVGLVVTITLGSPH